jgi:hypothetical protein
MSTEHIIQIKRWAATGLQTHEVHSIYFPDLELWEVHNAIYFDGKCRSEPEMIRRILQQHAGLERFCHRQCRPAVGGISSMIRIHEQKLIEMKLYASVAYRNKSAASGLSG